MKKIIGIFVCMLLIFPLVSANSITIKNNSPPNKPVLFAPKIVISDRYFIVQAVSQDIDGDDIYYRFNTNNQWVGPYNSGSIHIGILKITNDGNFELCVQAKDTKEAESDWNCINITVIKNRCFIFNLLNLFRLFR